MTELKLKIIALTWGLGIVLAVGAVGGGISYMAHVLGHHHSDVAPVPTVQEPVGPSYSIDSNS